MSEAGSGHNNKATKQGRIVKVTSLWRLGILAFVLGIVVTLAFMVVYVDVVHGGRMVKESTYSYYKALDSEFGKYYEMETLIKKNSLYKSDTSKLDSAVSSAVLGTINDKYAEYLTKDEYSRFERKYLDSYTGIGVATEQKTDGSIVITKVLANSPAEGSGIKAGDIITKINGSKPKDLEDASDKITGKAGTSVTVEISRKGSTKSFVMDRAAVEDESVTYSKYDTAHRIGYIKIDRFRNGTTDELKDAVRALRDDGYKKILIDLRGNTGGIMKEGVDSADLFLPGCRILTVKNNKGKEKVYNSDESTEDVDYVVLVDGDTASSAEIFAGAVKDNKGGKVVGTRTYGKGLIQELYKLNDGSVLRMTVQEYYSPNGGKIDGVGIEPDIKVSGSEDAAKVGSEYLISH